MSRIRKIILATMAAGSPLAPAASGSAGVELWMFTRPDCAACAQFEREVGRLYADTSDARRAPLLRHSFYARRPAALRGAGEVIGTPTFVLMQNGREIGRIEGYSSDELFWMRLTALLDRSDGPSSPDSD